jgi:hypothetical protein
MNIKVNVEIPRNLPIRELDRYIDYTVYNMARITLDFTNSKQRFPYLTGELNRAAMAEGVVAEGGKSYHLGASGVDYAPDVWDYPQSTNWTNPSTYAQWYMTEFKNEKELIVKRAVENAKRGFKL